MGPLKGNVTGVASIRTHTSPSQLSIVFNVKWGEVNTVDAAAISCGC